MRRILAYFTAFVLLTFSAIAQEEKSEPTDTLTSYIPLEGRSETGVPKNLQGTWQLLSGVKNVTPPVINETKKLGPGNEIKRDSTTTTTNINGETRITTEVHVNRVVTPENSITPAQKEQMHHPEKPTISFYGLNETFSGFTGCNKYSGRYSINGNKISLKNASSSTKMKCMGIYDEDTFLAILQKVTGYRTVDGRLEFLTGDKAVMVFTKK